MDAGIIGGGIYTANDIAKILEMSTSKINYLLKDYWDSKFGNRLGTKYSFGSNYKAIDFYTLIELYVYKELKNIGVSSIKIYKAHEVLSNTLDTKFPFAHAKLLTDTKSIFFEGDAGEIINADLSRQYNFVELITPFCRKIEFGKNLLPIKFYPDGKDSVIVVDPRHQFGLPTISGTNILAETICNLHNLGESNKTIELLFDISEDEIMDAIKFCRI